MTGMSMPISTSKNQKLKASGPLSTAMVASWFRAGGRKAG
jgi:hypothetical protein